MRETSHVPHSTATPTVPQVMRVCARFFLSAVETSLRRRLFNDPLENRDKAVK